MSVVSFDVDGHAFVMVGDEHGHRVLDRHGRQWTREEIASLAGNERRADTALGYAHRDLLRAATFGQ